MKKRIIALALAFCMIPCGTGYVYADTGDQDETVTEQVSAQESQAQETQVKETRAQDQTETQAETGNREKGATEDDDTGIEDDTAKEAASKDKSGTAAGSDTEDEPEYDLQDDEKVVYETGHAKMITSGDMVAQYLDPDEAQDEENAGNDAESPADVQKLSKDQITASLRELFAQAFDRYESIVDLSDYDLYVRDESSDEDSLDGEAIITEAYQTAVTGDDFYITGDFKFGYGEDSGKIINVSVGYGSSFRKDSPDSSGSVLPAPDKDKIKAAQKIFDAAAKDALAYTDNGESDLEKVLLLHDYIVTECSYDYGNNKTNGYYPDDDYTAYGVLVNHKAVCNGYAFAFSWLAQQAGIESYIIASDKMDHAWNLVRLDGKWYHVDTARDDKTFTDGKTYFSLKNEDTADEGYVSHRYFLRSDSEMKDYGYHDWTVQASSGEVPSAQDSGSYSDYLFRTYPDGAFARISGKWYLGSLEKRTIYGSPSLLTKEASPVYRADDLMYAVGSGSLIYYNRRGGVCVFDPADGKSKVIWQTADDDSVVSEMGIKDGKLVYIVLDKDGSSKRTETDISSVSACAAPGTPDITGISAADNGITVKWKAVSGADGYIVYISGSRDGKYSKLTDVSGGQTVSYAYQPGDINTHYYKLRAFVKHSGSYVYSEYSKVMSGHMSDGWMIFSDGSKKYFKNGAALTGKHKIGGSWYYFDKKTAKMKTGWVTSGSSRYYFDKSTGKALTGWQVISGKGYYFKKSNARAYTGWHKIGGRKYYFTKKGRLKKTPAKVLTGGYFFNKKGKPVTGWKRVGGRKYYFSKKTYKRYTGLHKIGKYKYYFNSSGAMKTGFRTIAKKRYYFKQTTGRMVTGWKKIGGKKYYFKKSKGYQLTGLVKIGKYTYYLYKKGGYAKGFKTVKGRKYYFRSNGRLDTGWQESSGGGMQYLSGGKPVTGLQTIYGKEFYFDKKGILQTGLVKISGKTYYFRESGGRAKDEYITLENADKTKKIAYFDKNGVRVTGTKTVDGNTYYLLANDGILSPTEKRQAVVTMALTYLKTKKGSSGHHKIVETYNSIKSNYKRNYTMTYDDAWCAASVSAWGAMTGMSDILLPECSCQFMIKNYQNRGLWVENDGYVPQIGDIVMYDWGDSGSGDDKGVADHVGIVISVFTSGGKTQFRVIEGNCVFNINTGNTITSAEKKKGKKLDNVTYFRGVGVRTMNVNGKYIRGFCTPAY